jgi:hypothetical protein
LHERIGARGVSLDHEDAPAFEDGGVFGRAFFVEQIQSRRGALLELVAKRAALLFDQRSQPLYEILDRFGDRTSGAEHDLCARALASGHRQNAASQLFGEQRDELVDARFAELAFGLARALGKLARELGDPSRHSIGARGLGHDGDDAVSKCVQPPIEARLIGQKNDRHHRSGRVLRETSEDRVAAVVRRIADQHQEIGCGDERGLERGAGRDGLDHHLVALERRLERSLHALAAADEKHGRSIHRAHPVLSRVGRSRWSTSSL